MNDEAAPRALIRFRLLGQVEAWRDGERVELGGRKQRAALASLLVRAGRVVSLDQIVDDLWPEHPPARAEATVQVFVSNLRRALEPDRPRGAPLLGQPDELLRVDAAGWGAQLVAARRRDQDRSRRPARAVRFERAPEIGDEDLHLSLIHI